MAQRLSDIPVKKPVRLSDVSAGTVPQLGRDFDIYEHTPTSFAESAEAIKPKVMSMEDDAMFDPSNVFGTVFGTIGGILSGGTLNEPAAALGGQIGQAIEEHKKARTIPNYDVEGITERIRNEGLRQAAYETVGRATAPIAGRIVKPLAASFKKLGQKLFGKAYERVVSDIITRQGEKIVTEVVGEGVLRHPIQQAVAPLARKGLLPVAKEIFETFQGRISEMVKVGKMTAKEAAEAKLTLRQISHPDTLQSTIESLSQHALGTSKIKTTLATSKVVYKDAVESAVDNLASGIRISPETISAPVLMVSPIKKAGIKSVAEAGVIAGEQANLGLRAFKETSKSIADNVAGMSKQVFKGEKIVDITDISDDIFKEAKGSKYFDFIGRTPEGKNIKKAISDVIEPYAKGTQKQIFDKSGRALDLSSLPPEVVEQLGGSKKALVSYDEAVSLYRQINNASQTIEKTAKGEKGTLKAIFGQLRDDLSDSMGIAARNAGGSDVHDAFLSYNDWYKKGVEPFQTDLAEKIINQYKEFPADTIAVLNSKNAPTAIKNIKDITGKNSDRVIQTLKDSWVENVYNTSQKLDPITKQNIADPVAIRRAIDSINPEAKKMLFKGGEIEKIQKNINEGIARVYSKKAITNPAYFGEFAETPEKTVKYIKSPKAEQELIFIKNSLAKSEADEVLNETGNRFVEGIVSNSITADIYTQNPVMDYSKITKGIESLSPTMEKLLFSGKPEKLKLFKKAVEQGLITQAPSKWGHIGSLWIGRMQIQALSGLAMLAGSIGLLASGRKKTGIAASAGGFAILFGPREVAKIFTDEHFLRLVLKIQKPAAQEIGKTDIYVKALYNALVRAGIRATLINTDTDQVQSDKEIVEPKQFPMPKGIITK